MHNIFLDAGGVILDETTHEKVRAELTVKIFQSYGYEYGISDYMNDLEEAVRIFALHVYRYIFWKNTGVKEKYDKLFSEYERAWKELNQPLVLTENLGEVLGHLSGKYKIGILGQYDDELKKVLDENNMLGFFSFTETQERYSLTKPDPRYFEQILKHASVDPEDSLMVGDRIDKDIIPAKMLGMKTVRVRTGIHKNQEPRIFEEIPDFDIDDIKELKRIL